MPCPSSNQSLRLDGCNHEVRDGPALSIHQQGHKQHEGPKCRWQVPQSYTSQNHSRWRGDCLCLVCNRQLFISSMFPLDQSWGFGKNRWICGDGLFFLTTKCLKDLFHAEFRGSRKKDEEPGSKLSKAQMAQCNTLMRGRNTKQML